MLRGPEDERPCGNVRKPRLVLVALDAVVLVFLPCVGPARARTPRPFADDDGTEKMMTVNKE